MRTSWKSILRTYARSPGMHTKQNVKPLSSVGCQKQNRCHQWVDPWRLTLWTPIHHCGATHLNAPPPGRPSQLIVSISNSWTYRQTRELTVVFDEFTIKSSSSFVLPNSYWRKSKTSRSVQELFTGTHRAQNHEALHSRSSQFRGSFFVRIDFAVYFSNQKERNDILLDVRIATTNTNGWEKAGLPNWQLFASFRGY